MLLAALVVELLAGLGGLVLHQPGGEQLLGEVLEVFEREPVRPELLLELLLRLFEGVLAVEVLDDKELLVVEAVVAQRDRVLDDVAGAALVLLRGDAEVGADPQPDELTAFQFVGGRRGGGHQALPSQARPLQRAGFGFPLTSLPAAGSPA